MTKEAVVYAGRSEQESVDDSWARVTEPVSQLTVDLRPCEWLGTDQMHDLIARLVGLKKGRVRFDLRLPESISCRNALRTCGFPLACVRALNQPFSATVAESDRQYFGEAPTLRHGQSTRLFGIRTSSLPDFAHREARWWAAAHANGPLRDRLGDQLDDLADRVLREALENSTIHPSASLIQTSTWFDGPTLENSTVLSLAVWDDGQSIPDHLERGFSLHPTASEPRTRLTREYNVNLLSRGKRVGRVAQSELGNPQERYEYLVAALVPGISGRAAAGQGEASPGMGFSVMLSVLVDSLGGTLSVRTSGLQMRVSRAANQGPVLAYNVDIRELSERDVFDGNLLTMTVPLPNTHV